MSDSERRAFNNDGMDPDWKPARSEGECRGSLLCNFEARKLIETEKERDRLEAQLQIAVESLRKLWSGPGNHMVNWKATWASGFAFETLVKIEGEK